MKYFELTDDVTVPKRWHLGEVTLADGTEPNLLDGISFGDGGMLAVPVDRPGRVLEFSLTSLGVPIATSRLAKAVSTVAGSDLESLPVNVAGQSGMMVLNAVRVLKCLDEERSEFMKWTKQDHRADLAGHFRQVTKLILAPDSVPAEAHLFRIEGWLVALIVSEAVKEAMEHVGCLGARFIELQT